MELILSKHASLRMRQRNISKKQIESTVLNPEIRLPTIQKSRRRVMKRIDRKTLDVIYKPLSHKKILIITAAWLTPEDRKVKG